MKKHFPFLLLSLSILSLSHFSFSQKVMTPEILWRLARVGGETLSPDGKNVVFGVSYINMEANKSNRQLYSMPVDGVNSKQITFTEASKSNVISMPGGKMGFMQQGQLWQCNWDGTEPVQITDIEGGIAFVKFSADGLHAIYAADVKVGKTKSDLYPSLSKSTAMVTDDLMYRHWDTWEDWNYSHIFVCDFSGGKLVNAKDIMKDEQFDCPQMPDGGAEDAVWSQDGKTVMYVCKKKSGKEYALSTNTDIYSYDLASSSTKNFTEGMNGMDAQPAYDPKGTRLAWTSMSHDGFEADKNDLILYDFKTKTKVNLTKDWDETVSNFVWSKDGNSIYFVADITGTEQIFELNLNSYFGKKSSFIRQITDRVCNITSMIGQTGNNMIVTRTDMNHPAEIFKVDLSSGTMTPMTFANGKVIDDLQTGKIEQRWINTTDHKKMLTWVIYPPAFDSTKKYPAILYCQGGPQSAVSQFYSYRWNFQVMAANNYIIIAPCRRGMPGFGVPWNADISKDWGGQAIQDYLSATDSISKLPFVDKNRIGAIGASYGGYSVYMLAGIHEGRFKSFIAHCGVFDLESWYLTTEEMWFANWDIGGNFWQKTKPAGYEKFNPKNFIGNWNTPIMVIHGAMDFRVPVNQGMEAFQAAQLRGIKSRFLYFPDEGHWVLKPQDGLLWQKEFFRWLKETL